MIKNCKQCIIDFLRTKGPSGTSALTQKLKITRQALNRHLNVLIKENQIIRKGRTRGAIYLLAKEQVSVPFFKKSFKAQGLQEDIVLNELEPLLHKPLSLNAKKIFRYTFSEMLNNAIDHSESKRIQIELYQNQKIVGFTLRDTGIGVFQKIQKAFKLPTLIDAINELLKGKVTTAPKSHSGEGIFFSSKACSRFILENSSLCLVCDNRIQDLTITPLTHPCQGTIVSIEINRNTKTNLQNLFSQYTDKQYHFSKTHIYIRLLAYGKEFISRSEAKRLLNRLESFKEVTLDFRGISFIGQGFADEIFRVFKHLHPSIQLNPINMTPEVAFMVKRARHAK